MIHWRDFNRFLPPNGLRVVVAFNAESIHVVTWDEDTLKRVPELEKWVPVEEFEANCGGWFTKENA